MKTLLSIPALVFMLIGTILGTLLLGAYSTTLSEIWQSFANVFDDSYDATTFLILNIRLPRILLAGFVGAGLAITGAAIQGLFRNPLAEPSLIGTTSGAMLFAVLAILFWGRFLSSYPELFMQSSVAIFAFVGSSLTTYLVYFLSGIKGRRDVLTMLLSGVAITAFASAITGICVVLSDDQQLRDITFWSLGSCSGADWQQIGILAPVILIGSLLLNRYSKALNAMLLGEKEAVYMGFEVEKIKTHIILLGALLVGVSIAMTGIIGFVGLVIPHFLRLIFGTNYQFLLRGSALLGAIFLILADTLSRTMIAPAELPIGILTALIGGPFFLWLLLKTQRKTFT